ncbi:ring-cleaving dioxygenase [Marinilactibacillus sp. GCM10026970]|uniref:ring-cleaving dioxygenase n=1 Tax=Marinilactibacillus sp. GCM10026970 TaxID=3252642 RepID=UPI0036091C18
MTNQEITGIHHVTAMTSSAEKNYEWFTNIIGLRLVKKTVNQDDIQTYHLFFADDEGNPGTDMTFFDFPNNPKGSKGTNDISRSSFRVPSDRALDYWLKRFEHFNVKHSEIKEQFGVKVIQFEDFDEQQYQLVSDENLDGVAPGKPWKDGPVPLEFAVYGLGPVIVRVDDFDQMASVLEDTLQFRKVSKENQYTLYEMGKGGNGGRLIIEESTILPAARQGYGSVHHVAFRVDDRAALNHWTDQLSNLGYANSGYVDRFYFESLYARMYPGVLFEFATDGPGFIDHQENYETLGEKLALPPAYEAHREQIEGLVRPIDTVRSTKVFEKEYFGFGEV